MTTTIIAAVVSSTQVMARWAKSAKKSPMSPMPVCRSDRGDDAEDRVDGQADEEHDQAGQDPGFRS